MIWLFWSIIISLQGHIFSQFVSNLYFCGAGPHTAKEVWWGMKDKAAESGSMNN